MDELSTPQPMLLSRRKVCSMLNVSHREFNALVKVGKLNPLTMGGGRHIKVPLAEVMSLKAEMTHRAIALPYEKFIQAATFFCQNATEINRKISGLKYPRAPLEYIERIRVQVKVDPELEIIKAKSLDEFFHLFGPAYEILKRPDVRLLVELLTMIQKGDKEIQEIVKAKYGREYGVDDIRRFKEYFYNWSIMDPESVKFYFEFLNGREKFLKEVAYKRADYFIYYALQIDFGGEVGDLLERSCLGLLHKFNLFVDGYVYGDFPATQKDLAQMADIIATLLSASQSARAGRVPKGKQQAFADKLIPEALSRGDFFDKEKTREFIEKPAD